MTDDIDPPADGHQQVSVPRKDLVSVLRGLLLMVVMAVVGLLLFGVASCQQRRINDHQAATDRHQAVIDARLQATIDRLDAQIHLRDLDTARACISNHVRYELFKQIMTDLVGDRPDVWARYPSPPCDRAKAQAQLDKG